VGDEIPEVNGMPDEAVRSTYDNPSVGGHDSEASAEKDLRVDLEHGSRELERDADDLRGDRCRRWTDEQDCEGTPKGDNPVPRMLGEPA